MTKTVGTIAALVLAGILFAPTKAEATTYTLNEVFDPASIASGCFSVSSPGASATYCVATVDLSTDLNLKSGDVVDLDVTFAGTGGTVVTVPSANSSSGVFASLADTVDCPGCPGTPYSASSTSTATLVGYVGPGTNVYGPVTFVDDPIDTYEAGFFRKQSNYPITGFSLTGFDAVIDINNTDPNAIDVVAFGTQTNTVFPTPEPGTIWLMLLGVGLVFAMRKRIGLGHSPAI